MSAHKPSPAPKAVNKWTPYAAVFSQTVYVVNDILLLITLNKIKKAEPMKSRFEILSEM